MKQAIAIIISITLFYVIITAYHRFTELPYITDGAFGAFFGLVCMGIYRIINEHGDKE